MATYGLTKLKTVNLNNTTCKVSSTTGLCRLATHHRCCPLRCVMLTPLPNAMRNSTPLRGVRECSACLIGVADSILSPVQGHSGPVTSLAALRLSDGSTLLASTAAEENVLIWECPPGVSSAAKPDNAASSTASQPLPCSSTSVSHSKEASSSPQPASRPAQERSSGKWSSWRLAQKIPWGVQLQHSAALTQLPGRPDWCESRCPSYRQLCLHSNRL